jgi:hypothetical protein
VNSKKPNFFVVGQPKAGTTALYNFLIQHPQVYLPPIKGLHFFDRDIREEGKRLSGLRRRLRELTLEDFLANYKSVKNEIAIGDVTPIYLFSKTAAAEICQFNAKSKIIAIFREPVEYMYSLHAQSLYSLGENEEDFKRALALEELRKSGKHIPKHVREPSMLFYRARTEYAEQLLRYLNYFPAEQIKIVIFEELKEDNQTICKEIFNFLNVDEKFVPDFKEHNAYSQLRLKKVRILLENLITINQSFQKNLPDPAARIYSLLLKPLSYTTKKSIGKITTKNGKKVPIDPNFKKNLMKEQQKQVLQFNELLKTYNLIDKDLISLWKYDSL